MEYKKAIEILRAEFVSKNSELFEKIKESKKTGSFKATLAHFDEFYMKDFLEVLETSEFFSVVLLQIYEELIYLHSLSDHVDETIQLNDYFTDDKIDEQKIIEKVKAVSNFLNARKTVELHVKEIAKSFGIVDFKLDYDESEFVCVKNYVEAIEKGKKITLHTSGDYQYLVSKIPLRGRGFVLSNLKINDYVFYSYNSEYIIQLAHVAEPGIYFIANIPGDEFVNAAFYILFVTEGDAYLIDNNIHALRSFLTRNTDRLIERRQNDTFLPWELISNFLENKSKETSLVEYKKEFPFKAIGKLSEINSVDILGIHSIIDTCLYTFTKTDFLNKVSPAATASMINIPIENKSNKELIVHSKQLPALRELDLAWNNELLELPALNANTYLEPFLKPKTEIELPKRDELRPLEQIQKSMMYEKRKQEAEQLAEELKIDYEKNWEKVKEKLDNFIKAKFIEKQEYWVKKALQDKEYSIKTYRQFSGFETFEQDEIKETKKKILQVNPKFYSLNNRHFFFIKPDYQKGHETCAICGKLGREIQNLVFDDVQQFVEFFELSEREQKQLPKQLLLYFNQARTMYDGNSILDDLDPITQINNPWWVSEHSRGSDSPRISISFGLCKIHKNKILKGMRND